MEGWMKDWLETAETTHRPQGFLEKRGETARHVSALCGVEGGWGRR